MERGRSEKYQCRKKNTQCFVVFYLIAKELTSHVTKSTHHAKWTISKSLCKLQDLTDALLCTSHDCSRECYCNYVLYMSKSIYFSEVWMAFYAFHLVVSVGNCRCTRCRIILSPKSLEPPTQ